MTALALIFLTCLVLSAFFSGSEMAFVSSNKLKWREMADRGHSPAQKIVRLQEEAPTFLTAILIGNNIVNIAATAILTYELESRFGIKNEWVVTAVMAPLLIVFGEMVPKDYCRLRSQNFLLKYAGILHFFVALVRFPVWVILRGIDALLGSLGAKGDKSIFVSEKEFRSLIEESAKTGVLGDHEKKLIDTVLDFERIQVESVMTGLEKVPKAELTKTVGEVKEIARRTKTRMVLVYEEIPSIVVGMIYVFDLLFEPDDRQGLKNYLRSPIFLPRHTSIEKAFLTLQQKRQSFAVVTGRGGDVIGTVPIERLLVL